MDSSLVQALSVASKQIRVSEQGEWETLQELPGHCWMRLQQSQHTNNVALLSGDGVLPLCLVVLRTLQHCHRRCVLVSQMQVWVGGLCTSNTHPFSDVGGLRQAPWNRNMASDIDAT